MIDDLIIDLNIGAVEHRINNEDLTENFCTNNENVEQLRKLYESQKAR